MKVLVTGGCGFLGTNLSVSCLESNDELIVLDSLHRFGSDQNLNWLRQQGKFDFVHADIRSSNDVSRVIREHKPEVIFHVAGQVAMTTSMANPRRDFEVNALGTLNVLEAVREYSPESIVLYSSTNKVYGDFENCTFEEQTTRYQCKEYSEGFDENVPLSFHSPYGCSKGTADQYMLDYARIYGLKTVVFRHSSIYGVRQFSTFDQGWVGWFAKQALELKMHPNREPFTISGNGKQVRDVLFSEDLIRCYRQAVQNIGRTRGEAFNIGGGMQNSLSLLELFSFLDKELGVQLKYTQLPWRESDQRVFVADIGKAKKTFDWAPRVNYHEGIARLIEWIK